MKKKSIVRNLFLSFSVFFMLLNFASCQTTNLSRVYVTNSASISILPPEDIDECLDCPMMLSVSFGKISFSALTYVLADESGIYLDITNDFGTDMGSLSFDGERVELDCPLIPSRLKGEYIINDFQFAFYQTEKIRKNLAGKGLDFSSEINEEGIEKRIVKSKEKIIESITIQQGLVTIENFLRSYTYILQF